jgi:Tfp pilus assembly protein PilX
VRRYERLAAAASAPRSVVLGAAEAELLQAELAYQTALQRYAQAADATRSADPQVRLAALDRLVTATSAALERAPDDPVINGYHLAAVRERDEVRRRIAKEQQKNWF